MIIRINPGNSEAIIHIMASVGVCLNILLSSEGVSQILESNEMRQSMSGSRIVINCQQSLIFHIMEVLGDPGFAPFRLSLVNALDEPNRRDFEIYSARSLTLPAPYSAMVNDLMESLIDFNADFIEQIYHLLTSNPNSTDFFAKDSCISFILIYIPHIVPHEGQHYRFSNAREFSPDNIYAHLWGAHAYRHETCEDLELVNQRIKLNQTLRTGIRNKGGITFKFKSGESFSEADTDKVLAEAKTRSGDNDVRLFGALNAVLTANRPLASKFERLKM